MVSVSSYSISAAGWYRYSNCMGEQVNEYTKEEMDHIIEWGTLPPKVKHDFKIGDRVVLKSNQKSFETGSTGEVVATDMQSGLEIRLDKFPNLSFRFHYSLVEHGK
jgi:hypothetical protein